MMLFRRNIIVLPMWILGVLLLLLVNDAYAMRLRDLCEIQGARGNMLKGIGYRGGPLGYR